MKKNSIIKNIVGCLCLLGLTVGLFSCEDVNDWGTDENYNQMFSPVTFETARVGATAVDIRFSKVPNAKSYVVELSKDSLAFNTIVNTIEIPAEQIVLDSTSTSEVYLTSVKKLDAETRYSARMKATSSKEMAESKWVTLTFKTPGEQILESVTSITENSALLVWEKDVEVTHIMLMGAGMQPEKITLSATNIAESKLELTGLKDDTKYSVEIYNEDRKRGSKDFATAQKISGDGTRYTLTGSENIVEFLSAVPESEVVLVIPTTANFQVGDAWTLPAHITSLTLWGLAGEGQGAISFKELKLDPSVTSFKIWIHNMKVSGVDGSADYIMNDNPSSARTIEEFKITNCDVSNVRGVSRMRGALTVKRIEIDNSIVSNIGSYGLLSIDAATPSVGDILIKNSTLAKFNNTNVIAAKAKPGSITIENCTMYGVQGSGRYLVNFDGKPANVTSDFSVSNCIFAAPDASVKVRGTNPKIELTFVYDSYKTNDYTLDETYPLGGISDYGNSSTNLFVDPENGNFKIKDTNIGGDKKPGDPRWW